MDLKHAYGLLRKEKISLQNDVRKLKKTIDELIIECSPAVSLDAVCEQMGRTPSWLPGIELRADGYECSFYQKQ